MSRPEPLSLFAGFGVELEYMIVDAQTLSVRPVADALLAAGAGEPTGDVERGEICWSNELVAHVVELKVNAPSESFEPLPALFQSNVNEINSLLAPLGARLMPAGMHPWMDPERETRLWPGEYGEVYQAFDRIFGCRGHGWANLQSVHLNLPFANDGEFARLHAAIRLVLPILPALTASSPVVEGRVTGLMDNRLEVYRTNSKKIAGVAGRVIPEPAFSQAAYQAQILDPLYAEIAPHDPAGVLRNEWLNARGAIARFSRNTIEIRVMDVQECPLADVAICAVVVAVLRCLVAERWSSLASQQGVGVEPLAEILLPTICHAEQALIRKREYLTLFGYAGDSCTTGELWRHLLNSLPEVTNSSSPWHEPLRVLLDEGPLARRITRALETEDLRSVYGDLCRCLATGEMFSL
ncbi:MAG TPA: glutamate-cysteine ligase family protein [Planctomycetaceae bacterium]